MNTPQLSRKLDQLIGKVEGLVEALDRQAQEVGRLSERLALVEQDTKRTKEVIEAWRAAKLWLRWSKWVAGFVASMIAVFAAFKGLSK
ncbi:MAG: hypothetical protein KKD64_14460 [Alphaproteobacteria bacterium]|nr:hypothetical protein [Alphaproteobacteria bacterium]MBU0794905.1 hypothetical protein [Alphaproteobacteria bacterium]MBU0875950.1 hypothetical protein [Alphaproteobacteria bacterium]MBU1770840.1 hypothetical protein [Alphaproteobacteria bacterium]